MAFTPFSLDPACRRPRLCRNTQFGVSSIREDAVRARPSALLAFVSGLRNLDDPLPFPPRLVAGLRTLLAADFVNYAEIDPLARASILHVWHDADGEGGIASGNDGDVACSRDHWWSVRPTHPTFGYRIVSGNWTTARKVSDFVTLPEFRRTPIYDAYYRGELDHWLDMGLASEPARSRLFVFTRFHKDDFDERDRLIAALLQPHLAERAEEAEAALRAAEAMAAIEDGTIEEARRVVLCSASGGIEFGSASSRALLRHYLGLDNGRVPTSVLARRGAHASGRRSLAPDSNRADGQLAPADARGARRTHREAHRARASGTRAGPARQGNDAIALELSIAPATVAKHLEHVYRRLGVQNRTAAAALLGSTR